MKFLPWKWARRMRCTHASASEAERDEPSATPCRAFRRSWRRSRLLESPGSELPKRTIRNEDDPVLAQPVEEQIRQTKDGPVIV
jgi:hypothetical protein